MTHLTNPHDWTHADCKKREVAPFSPSQKLNGLIYYLGELYLACSSVSNVPLVTHGVLRGLSEAGLRGSPQGTTVRRSEFRVSRVPVMQQSETLLTSIRYPATGSHEWTNCSSRLLSSAHPAVP